MKDWQYNSTTKCLYITEAAILPPPLPPTFFLKSIPPLPPPHLISRPPLQLNFQEIKF